jgi:hypothetical protein
VRDSEVFSLSPSPSSAGKKERACLLAFVHSYSALALYDVVVIGEDFFWGQKFRDPKLDCQ